MKLDTKNQMQNKNTYVVGDMTAEDFAKKLEEVMADMPPPPRQFVIHTGIEGAKRINHEIEREPWRNWLKELFDGGLVDEQQYERLNQMIDSPDHEAFVLAQEIILDAHINIFRLALQLRVQTF